MTSKDILLILLTSFALIFSFPPFPTGFLALVAFIPFFFYAEGKNLKELFRDGYLIGLIWSAGTIFWIGHATIIGVIGAIIWVAFYFAFFSLLYGWVSKKIGQAAVWTAPFIWVSLELLSSVGPMAFPWNSLANTQTYYPIFIQYISITGMYGITVWIVFFNVISYILIKNLKCKKNVILCTSLIIILIGLPLLYNLFISRKELNGKEKVKISLIQGNIDPYKKWTSGFINENFYIYRDLTLEASRTSPDLIVWPETAAPCYLRSHNYYRNFMFNLVNNITIPILTGTIDYDRRDTDEIRRYNSVFLFKPDRDTIESYNKIHLVPFSERVPFVDKFPFLYNLAKIDLNIGDYFPGDSTTVFKMWNKKDSSWVKFSAGICYDSVFPYLNRRFVRNGAQFIIIITNDGWFGSLSGPYQHAQIAVLRAIENRVWVIRCANTGISEFIDPFGRIIKKTELSERTILTQSIYVSDNNTFFSTHGYYFIYLILLFDLFILIVIFIRKKIYKDS